MIIYDGEYHWDGWGGKMRLGHGKCRLCIFDLRKKNRHIVHFKPFLVVVSDLENSPTLIKNYGGHIATGVIKKFQIDPNRMIWVEFYPEKCFGVEKEKIIPERFDETEFKWLGEKAIQPKWKPLNSPILDTLKQLLLDHHIQL